jgi:RNA polymerase sigma-70 factor (ECF subfamily)
MAIELDDFDDFYRRTYTAAYRTALGVIGSPSLAEDVTQEAFVDAYRHQSSYRGQGSAEAWLQRIVVNRAIDELRRRGRRAEVPFEMVPEETDSRAAETDQSELLDAIARLDSRQRAAVVLRHFHGYPLRTVGEVLGTSEGGASMLLQRAMDRLRPTVAGTAPTSRRFRAATKSAPRRG